MFWPLHLLILSIAVSRFGFGLGSSICSVPDLVSVSLYGIDPYPQCPLSIELSPPSEITGEVLDRVLNRGRKNDYNSIFFYASWCPFSQESWPLFNALSSMFPHISHFRIEESSALPSVFSIYGVHSFPTIMIVNQTRRIPYHGPKDLGSLVYFYKKATGFEPNMLLSPDHLDLVAKSLETEKSHNLWMYSPREILAREPYLALATTFLVLQVFLYFFPGIVIKLRAFCDLYLRNINVGIFGGPNQLLGRALQVIDVKRLWSKLSLFNKTRNFQKGANNARVWASSLASVSLGESSSPRPSPADS